MPTWGTLLGLVVDGQPVAGVMHQPFTDETFAADPARGSRFLRAGSERTLRTRASATLEDAVMYSTHPAMLQWAGVLDQFQRARRAVRLQRWGGDCYSFALVAMGTIDLVVDGCLMPYDIVPLIPIIELAGGVVTDIEGRVPMHGGTVIAAANPRPARPGPGGPARIAVTPADHRRRRTAGPAGRQSELVLAHQRDESVGHQPVEGAAHAGGRRPTPP